MSVHSIGEMKGKHSHFVIHPDELEGLFLAKLYINMIEILKEKFPKK